MTAIPIDTAMPAPDWSLVSLAVRKARRQQQESLRQFGKRLGVRHQVIHDLENGEPVKVEAFLKVCAGLDADPFVLCGMKQGQGGGAS